MALYHRRGKMKIRMKYRKATKNTFVFDEVLADGREADKALATIPSLYIRKSALTKPAQYITVTVEIENENSSN
jgi:hypothetical protein